MWVVVTFWVAAFIAFILGICGWKKKVNFTALGLALWTIGCLFRLFL